MYSLVSGTARGGSDFETSSGTLTFPPGTTRATKTLYVSNDAVDEPDETFAMVLSSPQHATLGAPSRHTVTIQDDDDPPTVEFGQGYPYGSELSTPATVDVVLSRPSARTVTVKYATTSGTGPHDARPGSDYLAKSGTLTFPPGQFLRTISVPIVNSREVELDESFTATLSNPVNATFGAQKEWIYVIHDEDTHGAIRLSAAAYSVGEAGPQARIMAKRVGGDGGPCKRTSPCRTSRRRWTTTAPVHGAGSWAKGDMADKTIMVPIKTMLSTSPTECSGCGSSDSVVTRRWGPLPRRS